ncbi:MAG: leader peptidase (prepilin peptidase) / N-methyltransferase [Actinomycetota bacterium]|jgi:leader peptidase (prepilin peptidase)/N-methyltransferase
MNGATVAVVVAAFLAGLAIAPTARRAIEETPPDPDDDPAPVPRVGPWLVRRRLLAPLLAVVAAGVAARTGAHPEVVAHVLVSVGLVVLSVIDLDLFLLPKRLVNPLVVATAALLAIAAALHGEGEPLWRALIAYVAAFGVLLVLHVISPRGMAFGDVRLAGLIGLDLGWFGTSQVVLGLFSGFVFASVIGMGLLLARRRGMRDAVPFGPFLAAGTLFVLFGGDLAFGLVRH